MFKNDGDNTFKDIKKEAKDLVDETFEVLDLTKKNDNIVDRIFGDVSKTPPMSQVAVGGGTGWVTGYVLVKVGKAAALTFLLTGVAFKVAHDKGLITINKKAMNKTVENIKKQAEQITANHRRSYTDVIAKVYHNYKYLTIGFSGGFLAAVLF